MTTESGLQSRQQRQALFAQRGHIAANAAKGLGSSHAAEAPRDLLLHFDHAQISLRQIVIKIHTQILQEGQHRLLVCAQAIKQVARSTLFASPPSTRRPNGMRMKPISFSEQVQEAGLPIGDFQRIKPRFSLFTGLVGGLLHIQEQLLEVCGPPQCLFFCQKDQLAQQMHDAGSMLTIVQEVRSPSVVDRDAGEMRQDADGFQGHLPSALIHVIVGEGRRARHVHPVAFAAHRKPRFILMNDLSFLQGLFDLLLHRGQCKRAAFDQFPDGPFTHLHSQQIPHHLTGAGQWQQLLFDQIHGSRSHVRSILDGSLHSGGKGGAGDVLAGGTLFLLGPIFAYQQTRRGDIHHLAPLSSTRDHRVQVLLTRFAALYLLEDDLIWRRRERQARSRVACLPSRFLLALGAQAFRFAHPPIRGGGQVTIVAIFGESVLQGLQLLAQAAHPLIVLLKQGLLLRQHHLLLLDEVVSLRQLFSQTLILFSQREQFFFDRHALTLLALTPFGKSPADLASYSYSYKTKTLFFLALRSPQEEALVCVNNDQFVHNRRGSDIDKDKPASFSVLLGS